jgi:hypothetical protein
MTAATWPQACGYDDVVDLGRYPINDPAGPAYRALVQAGRDQLRDQGVAQFTGFLTPAAVSQMVVLASELTGQGWASDQTHTVYFEPADDSAGPDHPRALLQHSAKKAIAYDQIPADAPIRRLYEADDLTAFIAAVLGKQVVYRSADPLDALEIAVFGDGDELGWHFDNSEFSVTVMYQQAEAGVISTTIRGCGTNATRTTRASRRSCTQTPTASSGCPAARARSRCSAASTPCTGSPRSAGPGRGSIRC